MQPDICVAATRLVHGALNGRRARSPTWAPARSHDRARDQHGRERDRGHTDDDCGHSADPRDVGLDLHRQRTDLGDANIELVERATESLATLADLRD
jgi:hypothetical protein